MSGATDVLTPKVLVLRRTMHVWIAGLSGPSCNYHGAGKSSCGSATACGIPSIWNSDMAQFVPRATSPSRVVLGRFAASTSQTSRQCRYHVQDAPLSPGCCCRAHEEVTSSTTATEHGCRLITAVSLHRQLSLAPLLQSMAVN